MYFVLGKENGLDIRCKKEQGGSTRRDEERQEAMKSEEENVGATRSNNSKWEQRGAMESENG